jgi:hypothetical protein
VTEYRLKNTIAIFLIIGHLLSIILVVVLRIADGFLQDEMTTAIALLTPMFAVYTTAVIAHLIDTRHTIADTSPVVTGVFVFLATLLPFLFVLSIICLILLKGFNIAFSNFEEFKTILAIIGTMFALYLGAVIRSLYKSSVQEVGPSNN